MYKETDATYKTAVEPLLNRFTFLFGEDPREIGSDERCSTKDLVELRKAAI